MTKKFKILSSICAWFCVLTYGATLTLTHACNNEISKHLDLTKTQMGYVYMCLYLGFFFSCVITGSIADRKGKLVLINTGVLILVLGLFLFVFSNSVFLTAISMALIGIGGGAGETNANGYIGDIWLGIRRNSMMNITQAFFAFGAFIGPIITGLCLKYGNYKLGFIYIGIIALLVFISTLICVLKKQEKPLRKLNTPWKYLLQDRYLILMMLCLMFYLGIESGFSEWASIYYIDFLSLNKVLSSQSIGLFWIGISIGSFFFASISKYITRMKMVIIPCLCVIICFALWLLNNAVVSIIMSFWIGYFLGPVFGTCLGMGSERQKENSGAATSILFGGAYIGGAFFPFLIGLIGDITNIKLGMSLIPWFAIGIICCVLVGRKIR